MADWRKVRVGQGGIRPHYRGCGKQVCFGSAGWPLAAMHVQYGDRLRGIGKLRAATVAVARAATVAVAVAVAVGVPVDGDTSLVPKSEKEASAV